MSVSTPFPLQSPHSYVKDRARTRLFQGDTNNDGVPLIPVVWLTLALPLGHILPDSNAAPALQAHQVELERSMKADSLESALKSRPAPDELVNKGILSENPAA